MWTTEQLRMLIDERKNNNEHYHDLVEGGKKMFWKELASKINLLFEEMKKERRLEMVRNTMKNSIVNFGRNPAEKEKAAKTLLLLSEEGNHHDYNDDNDDNDDNE
ncbi:hypothetical protein RhiirA4_471501 [Rhizophagus irregularis]|uniref:Uncharacterized protein n=1 Tax=Rhizophagus irregularis TaxID=588596 RepID=A0A2I1H3E9_9GLOM|nr:hypothetical protein RhiirA4_471501 [Rhizophagus irregularis]